MAGQLFTVAAEGGYAYSDKLSKVLRMQVQPLTKFRQLCDMEDGSEKALHSGANFVWNGSFSNTAPVARIVFDRSGARRCR